MHTLNIKGRNPNDLIQVVISYIIRNNSNIDMSLNLQRFNMSLNS
jgi:hypothetical protein